MSSFHNNMISESQNPAAEYLELKCTNFKKICIRCINQSRRKFIRHVLHILRLNSFFHMIVVWRTNLLGGKKWAINCSKSKNEPCQHMYFKYAKKSPIKILNMKRSSYTDKVTRARMRMRREIISFSFSIYLALTLSYPCLLSLSFSLPLSWRALEWERQNFHLSRSTID